HGRPDRHGAVRGRHRGPGQPGPRHDPRGVHHGVRRGERLTARERQVLSTMTTDLESVRATTSALQTAIDDAAARGGGRIVIPAGVHVTGARRLRSRTELHLEAGAVLRFATDPTLFSAIDARWEGERREVHQPCLWARDETDVSITGRGTIDGAGEAWWRAFREDPSSLALPRPTLVGLHGCSRGEVSGVTLVNSPPRTLHPLRC